MTTEAKYELLKKKLKEAGSSGNKAHVMPKSGRWIVYKEGNNKVLGNFSRRYIALNMALKFLNSGGAESVVLHKYDGKVEKILSA